MKKYKKIWIAAIIIWFVSATCVDYFFGQSIRTSSWSAVVFSVVKTTILLGLLYKLVSDKPK